MLRCMTSRSAAPSTRCCVSCRCAGGAGCRPRVPREPRPHAAASLAQRVRCVDTRVPRAPESLQAFQYHEKNGDVCPEGWKPGAKTMKADPLASMEYFSQLK